MSDSQKTASSTVFGCVFGLYLIIGGLSFPVFHYTYIKEHSFVAYLFGGEIVATFKAIGWPYFLPKLVRENRDTSSSDGDSANQKKEDCQYFEDMDKYHTQFSKYAINQEGLPLEEAKQKMIDNFNISYAFFKKINASKLAPIDKDLPAAFSRDLSYCMEYERHLMDQEANENPENLAYIQNNAPKYRDHLNAWIDYCKSKPDVFDMSK